MYSRGLDTAQDASSYKQCLPEAFWDITSSAGGRGLIIWRPKLTTSVCKPYVFLVTFRLPSAAASSFISSSSSLVVALLRPRERQAALPRCDGSSSVFNYRGGWDVCLSCDEPMHERQRAEAAQAWLKGSDLNLCNAWEWLLIGAHGAGGRWKASF